MDLVCWKCKTETFYARYDKNGFIVQCAECGEEEVMG